MILIRQTRCCSSLLRLSPAVAVEVPDYVVTDAYQ